MTFDGAGHGVLVMTLEFAIFGVNNSSPRHTDDHKHNF